ncbi:exonuclease domain-containing protein [Pseudoclavibacter helvolus]|uniref:exonuclease domain-containing protein n=1 Tax=Pseudoclavibacter helvolus TaxID=255205 RepID=UPI0008393380|nr:exonuclease domain-containing protein [Pseudoclavibacter helvolus]
MALDFVSIDFETANHQRGSVCQIGVTDVRDGRVVSTDAWYILPPTGLDFTNTHIHGISASHVRDAPSWAETLRRLTSVVRSAPVVAYRTFDKSAYSAANTLAGLPDPGLEFFDALVLAKSRLDLESYKLPHVAKHLGLPSFSHHDAEADALACAQIVLHLSARDGHLSAPGFSEHEADVRSAWTAKLPAKASRSGYAHKLTVIPETNAAADRSHPLFGEVVCFSGDLDSHSRAEAQKLVADRGATVGSGVTKKTTLVVMGGYDPATLRPGAKVSGKVQKALDLAAKGQRVEIVTEEVFLELLRR